MTQTPRSEPDEITYAMRWARTRHYLDQRLDEIEATHDGVGGYGEGYRSGYAVALQEIKVRFFLTAGEGVAVEAARREMFG